MYNPASSNPRSHNKAEDLQHRLKAATKLKISIERQTYTLHNTERQLREELYSTKLEVDLLTQQLEDLKDNISDVSYRIAKAEMQKVEAKIKLESYSNKLKDHQQGFVDMFAEERNKPILRNEQLKEKLAEEMEIQLQKQREIDRQNQLQVNQAAALEEECSSIERESTVLKKRNAAIMLKLRRKLVEAEDARRELLARRSITQMHK